MRISTLKRKAYPEKKAELVWKSKNWLGKSFVCSIVKVTYKGLARIGRPIKTIDKSHYCGYVRFEKPIYNEYWLKRPGFSKSFMMKTIKVLQRMNEEGIEEDETRQAFRQVNQRIRMKRRHSNYDGFLSYVPVHGGITFAEKDDFGVVYGFDCAHMGDDENENVKNIKWLKKHCEAFGKALLLAKPYKERYDKESNEDKKYAIINEYRRKLDGSGEDFNFGLAINLLTGEL